MEKEHKRNKKIIIGLVAFIAALLVFQAGISVGYHRAAFSYRGGERYFRMMEGPTGGLAGFSGGMMGLSANHGAAGRIVSVSLPSFVVASPDNREETVVIGDDTAIRMFRNTASTSDIRPNSYTVVLGDPDDAGNIQARFIRLMPASTTPQTQPLNY